MHAHAHTRAHIRAHTHARTHAQRKEFAIPNKYYINNITYGKHVSVTKKLSKRNLKSYDFLNSFQVF